MLTSLFSITQISARVLCAFYVLLVPIQIGKETVMFFKRKRYLELKCRYLQYGLLSGMFYSNKEAIIVTYLKF